MRYDEKVRREARECEWLVSRVRHRRRSAYGLGWTFGVVWFVTERIEGAILAVPGAQIDPMSLEAVY